MAGAVDPFAPARWELVPGATVLLLIDLQNDFLHPDGWYAQNGIDISHMRRVIEPTARLLEASRGADVPVVWTRHGYRDGRDAGPFRELKPIVVEECTGTTLPHLHEPAIEMMRVGWAEVRSLEEAVRELTRLSLEVEA